MGEPPLLAPAVRYRAVGEACLHAYTDLQLHDFHLCFILPLCYLPFQILSSFAFVLSVQPMPIVIHIT
jgi:hypothetical protein